jgi:hypothetical protein
VLNPKALLAAVIFGAVFWALVGVGFCAIVRDAL